MQKGGTRVFYRKVKKLFKLLYMGLLAPAAVHLRIDWPEAYYFVWSRLLKRHKKICLRFNERLIQKTRKIENVVIDCIERYMARAPDLTQIPVWIWASSILFTMSYSKESFEKAIGVLRNLERIRRELLRNHQLDDLGFEFIPGSLAIGSIGVWENLEVYIKMGILGLKTPKKLVLLLDPESRINNPCYLKYWRRYMTVISDPLLIQAFSPLEKCMTVPINYYMSFQGRVMLSPEALGFVRKQWNEEKRPPLLKLSDDDFEQGWKCLNSSGVPNHAWFVCLHVRESGWNDNDYVANYRNADIKTYVPAIKAITDAGGWVIRMGDPSTTPLPEMDHAIDYAHSDMKSDLMDIFLCSQCRFIIGTSSGVYTISIVFGVPAVLTNYLPGNGMYQLSAQDIFIPRLCLSKDDNHYLSFRELMCPPVSMAPEQHIYDRFNLKVIENTPEEIRDIVMEMLTRMSGTIQYSEGDEYLQGQFRSLSARCGKLYGDDGIVVNARVGRDFLRKYAGLLPAGVMEECSNKK